MDFCGEKLKPQEAVHFHEQPPDKSKSIIKPDDEPW
jgi:hypothetical protein